MTDRLIIADNWTLGVTSGKPSVFLRIVQDPTGKRKKFDYTLLTDLKSITFKEGRSAVLCTSDNQYFLLAAEL